MISLYLLSILIFFGCVIIYWVLSFDSSEIEGLGVEMSQSDKIKWDMHREHIQLFMFSGMALAVVILMLSLK